MQPSQEIGKALGLTPKVVKRELNYDLLHSKVTCIPTVLLIETHLSGCSLWRRGGLMILKEEKGHISYKSFRIDSIKDSQNKLLNKENRFI